MEAPNGDNTLNVQITSSKPQEEGTVAQDHGTAPAPVDTDTTLQQQYATVEKVGGLIDTIKEVEAVATATQSSVLCGIAEIHKDNAKLLELANENRTSLQDIQSVVYAISKLTTVIEKLRTSVEDLNQNLANANEIANKQVIENSKIVSMHEAIATKLDVLVRTHQATYRMSSPATAVASFMSGGFAGGSVRPASNQPPKSSGDQRQTFVGLKSCKVVVYVSKEATKIPSSFANDLGTNENFKGRVEFRTAFWGSRGKATKVGIVAHYVSTDRLTEDEKLTNAIEAAQKTHKKVLLLILRVASNVTGLKEITTPKDFPRTCDLVLQGYADPKLARQPQKFKKLRDTLANMQN